jgi:hypothetical protein
MRLIDIEGDRIVPTPECLAVPEFHALWKRDRSKFKKKAIQELTYVTFLVDNTIHNPYRGYGEDVRDIELRKDYFEEGWTPDQGVQDAVGKYRSMQKTTSSRLVSAAQVAADKLADYYTGVNFIERDENGKLVYSASEVQKNIKDLSNTIKSLFALEEQLRKEQLDGNLSRGGFEIGEFELPSKDINYGEADLLSG